MLTNVINKDSEEVLLQQDNVPAMLFIEQKDKPLEQYHQLFSESYYVSSFQEAMVLLKKMEILSALPEMIIIDIPFQKDELFIFRNWMKDNLEAFIPTVYNIKHLNSDNAMLVFKNRMVHDVINVSVHYNTLAEKARFLKKSWNQSPNEKRKRKPLLDPNCKFCFSKRIIDVVLSFIAIILFLPVFIVIAIIIKFESKGPIIYKSKRAGKGFKVFNFLKFRTMVIDADKKLAHLSGKNQYHNTQGPSFFKIKDDPRITRFGKFLRNSSLDELPQLFNVLKGDMSIVGNRPLPLYEANSLTTDEWAERFMAPAGITGLWQISKRGNEEMSSEERVLLDISYARNRSLSGDLKIMLKTPSALLQKTNV